MIYVTSNTFSSNFEAFVNVYFYFFDNYLIVIVVKTPKIWGSLKPLPRPGLGFSLIWTIAFTTVDT